MVGGARTRGRWRVGASSRRGGRVTPFLIVTGDFTLTGGMDRANYALASYLARQGHAVHLVAFRADAELLAAGNVHFHRVVKPLNSYALGLPLLDRVGRRWARRLSERGGRVIVNGGNCQWGDVNWVHSVHAAWTPVTRGSVTRGAKARLQGNRNRANERRALRSARLIITNSRRTADDVKAAAEVANERVHVVYYGSDADRFSPASTDSRRTARKSLGWDDRPVIAFIGALSDRRKGFDTLFDAWQLLREHQPGLDAVLAVIGKGSELAAWKARAQRSSFARSIRFLGFRHDLPQLLQACDALVAPTRYEAYGLAVHEALCCGLPAIVSSSAGVAVR